MEFCGGTGRLYYYLLRHIFQQIDFNELVSEHIEEALKLFNKAVKESKRGKTGEITDIFPGRAENVELDKGYDCVWKCWCHGYLKR